MNSKELFAEVARKADTEKKPIDAAVSSRVSNTLLDVIAVGIQEGRYSALEVVTWFAKELDKRKGKPPILPRAVMQTIAEPAPAPAPATNKKNKKK